MAERPPKVPNYRVKPPPTKESDTITASPSIAPPPDHPWANKFAEFCRVKRAVHRSAATESTSSMDGREFDQLDDDLLLTMFPENRHRVLSSNVMPEISEHNSNTICEADKKELDEADSSEYKVETEVLTGTGGTQIETSSPPEVTSSLDGEGAPTTDPKRVKRCVGLVCLSPRISTRDHNRIFEIIGCKDVLDQIQSLILEMSIRIAVRNVDGLLKLASLVPEVDRRQKYVQEIRK